MAYIKISELDPLITGLTDNVLIPLALVNDTYNITASMIKKYVMGEIVSISPSIPGGIYEIQCAHLFKRLVTTTPCELIIEDCSWADQSWVEFSNHSSSICEITATPLLSINGSTSKTFYIQPESTAILKKTTDGWDLHGIIVEHGHIIADVTGLQTALDSKLSSFTETDPVFTASPSFGISSTNITNWNSAFSWGNHASAGYQDELVSGTNIKTINGTSLLGSGDIVISTAVEWADILNKPLTFTPSTHNHAISDVTGLQTALDSKLSSFTEVDPVFVASAAAGITSTNITNWNSAFSWGNHASAGYLTSFTETDPVFTASPSFGITGTNITNWNSAFSWGNHASAGYQDELVSGTNIKTINGASLLGSGDIIISASGSVEWVDVLNKPLTFTPTTHTHIIADVTGLQTALDSKLSSFTETDPIFTASPSFGISSTNITNWNSAFSWGNHASAGYQAGLVSGTNIKTINGTSLLGSGDIVISGGSGGGFFYGETTPVSPAVGDRWVKPSTASEYTYINDGDSFAWVDLNSSGTSSGLVQVFIQDTTPVVTGPYLWVQTGISGGDFSLWFNDGV